MELLAPAGSMVAFKAALLGGADAIYLGGKSFGARRQAANFTNQELQTAVRAAHKRGVKVYVTVNTLIKEGEVPSVFSYLDYLESIAVDAVILQDRGLLRLILDSFSLPVYASTQMNIHSPEGVVWAEKNGISRVILARELRLEELEAIREATRLELEVFIHGALCYSFSGQCLFSSAVGGRSGNRGLCAQPCRMRYKLGRDAGYLLSTADLFGVDAIPNLLRLGVEGLKIEGRMRSPLYVYLTSKIYSAAIRRAEDCRSPLITQREKELLEIVFNRGFTRGYLADDDVMQRAYAGSRGQLLGVVDFDGKTMAIKVDSLRSNDGVTLYRQDEKVGGFGIHKVEREQGFVILRPPFKLPKGGYQVYKTKDRVFDSIQKRITEMTLPPASGQTTVRRFSFTPIHRNVARGDLSFYVSSLKSLEAVIPYADRVYFDWNSRFPDAYAMCDQAGIDCVLILPRFSFGVPPTDAESLMVCSIDQFEAYSGRKLYGHYAMNFFNSLTIPRLFQYTLSVELSKEDIEEIARHYAGRMEVMVFGRIELMISRDPLLDEGTLIDRKRKRFPVYRDRFGFIHILNSSDLFLLDYLDDLENMGINSFGIDLRRRNPVLSELVAKAFYQRDLRQKAVIKKMCNSITARHYLRGVI
ncbi:MAG: U32 family peptidase [Candidatus Bathyarchaeota archaeon]|nr:U32 family peptidase [Candidatus Bathyarchaeota archaeon]